MTDDSTFIVSPIDYETLLKYFGLVLNQAALYTMNHKISKDALDRFYFKFQEIIKKEKALEINISENCQSVSINGKEVQSSNPIIKILLAHLGSHKFFNTKITDEATFSDIIKLFNLLSQEASKLKDKGGIAAIIVQENIKGIFLEEVVYKKIAKGQKVVSEKEISKSIIDEGIIRALHDEILEDTEKKKQLFQALQMQPKKLAKMSIQNSLEKAGGSPDSIEFGISLIESLKRIGETALREITSTTSLRIKKNILKAFEIFEKEIIRCLNDIRKESRNVEAEKLLFKTINSYKQTLELEILSADLGKKQKEIEKMEGRLKLILQNEEARNKLAEVLEDDQVYKNILLNAAKPTEFFQTLPVDTPSILEDFKASIIREVKSLSFTGKIQSEEMDMLLHKIDEVIKNKMNTAMQSIKKFHNEFYNSSKQITKEKDKLGNILKGVSKGVVVLDDNGKVLFMDNAAENVIGTSAKEQIGKNIKESLSKEHLLTLSKSLLHKDTGKLLEVLEYSGDEETREIVQSSTVVLQDQNGKPLGIITTVKDIQKQKEFLKMQKNFIDNVTHELKTPLVAIKHTVKLIMDSIVGEATEQQKKFMDILQKNTKRINSLIDNMLKFSQTTSDRLLLALENHSVESLFNDSISPLKAWIDTKKITIDTKIPENCPEVQMDFEKILHVMNCLLNNAIKFTPINGHILLEAEIKTEPKYQNKYIQISVSDNGKGIPEENFQKIFKKFVHAGEKDPMDLRGTGMGLPIAKKIINVHNGKIWVNSELDKGSTFFFILPLEIASISFQ
ncbi:MAG: PAS domain S-box protein [Candidatus Aureabacteria bacterium]|nr:PAS domain S-box protein [Candidatus Auribacterota bacterium]